MKKIICLILLVMFAMEPIAFAASSPHRRTQGPCTVPGGSAG